MNDFELTYKRIVARVLAIGDYRQTRNVATKAVFGEHLAIDMDGERFPMIMGRQMYHKGVFGELAAMLRKPTHVDDFRKWGCNYWDKWGKADGSINVDYGNAWFDGGQMDHLRHSLLNNTADRRMLISGWRPERLAELDLPCCHCSYQFFVRGKTLDMIWNQRSVDVMVGLPSDIVFAAAWLIAIASWAGLEPGRINMFFGDTHIYENHFAQAEEYLATDLEHVIYPRYEYMAPGKDFLEFEPSDIIIQPYKGVTKLELELNA